jgi:hypothetical protein
MEPWSNPVEELHLTKVGRTADGNASPWQRLQQLQRWKTHMQRLGQALDEGNLGQARHEFEALINDAPEIGQADPMAHPQFAVLGKSLLRGDLEGAREAFAKLQSESPSLRHHRSQEEPVASREPAEEGRSAEQESSGTLDVTA